MAEKGLRGRRRRDVGVWETEIEGDSDSSGEDEIGAW
jgi:hypothetical protein